MVGRLDSKARRLIRCLKKLRAPTDFIRIVKTVHKQQLVPQGISLVDFFEGIGEPKQAARRRGRLAVGFDYKNDPILQNMGGDAGFVTAVCLICGVEGGGQSSVGTPCNSFVFMSSSLNARSWVNPTGDKRYKFVSNGNLVVYRMVSRIMPRIVLNKITRID